jgi:hypothetical protein
MRTPRTGTLQRAVFDAMHAACCGPDCPPSCREWRPNKPEQDAAIAAVRRWDDERFAAFLARERGTS